jgi:hypothetical protein
MGSVSIVAIVLLAAAVLVVVGAEWGRLRTLGPKRIERRSRARRKQKLTLVRAVPDDADDFAASVERDLANLPVIEERDRS